MYVRKKINFNQLEKEIFKIGCEYAQEIAMQLMGEVEFERAVYETRNEKGEKAYVCLLDEIKNLRPLGKYQQI